MFKYSNRAVRSFSYRNQNEHNYGNNRLDTGIKKGLWDIFWEILEGIIVKF